MTTDTFAFFGALGIELAASGAGLNRQTRCFANPEAHQSGDRTPSCSVNIETGAWRCFTCGTCGNAYAAAVASGLDPRSASDVAKAHGLWHNDEANHSPRPQHAVTPARPSVGPKAAPLPTEEALEIWTRSLRSSPTLLGRAWQARGWTAGALAVLGVGWDGQRFTIPVRDRQGTLVNVVRYLPGGKPKSLALAGRPRDLFPAPERLRLDGPELFQGDGPEVFIVEGEGDAIAAQSVASPIYAVAVPGANGWRPEYGARFAGMRVRVLTDFDDAGRTLAERVAADTLGYAVEVRVLDWASVVGRADLPSGFDLTDWATELRSQAKEVA